MPFVNVTTLDSIIINVRQDNVKRDNAQKFKKRWEANSFACIVQMGMIASVDCFLGNADRFDMKGGICNTGNIMFTADDHWFPIGLDNFDVKNPSALLSREPVKGSWMGEHLKDQNSIEHFAVCVKKEFDKILHNCGCPDFDPGFVKAFISGIHQGTHKIITVFEHEQKNCSPSVTKGLLFRMQFLKLHIGGSNSSSGGMNALRTANTDIHFVDKQLDHVFGNNNNQPTGNNPMKRSSNEGIQKQSSSSSTNQQTGINLKRSSNDGISVITSNLNQSGNNQIKRNSNEGIPKQTGGNLNQSANNPIKRSSTDGTNVINSNLNQSGTNPMKRSSNDGNKKN